MIVKNLSRLHKFAQQFKCTRHIIRSTKSNEERSRSHTVQTHRKLGMDKKTWILQAKGELLNFEIKIILSKVNNYF
jgi:hypothetical protein